MSLTPDQVRHDAFKGFAYFRRVLNSNNEIDRDMRRALVLFINATEDHLSTMWGLVAKGIPK